MPAQLCRNFTQLALFDTMPKLLNIKFQVSITVGELVLHNAIVFKQVLNHRILFQPQSIDEIAGNIGKGGGGREET